MSVALFLTAFDGLGNRREFSCLLNSMEDCFDFLNHLVASGNTLLTAYTLDGNGRRELPVAAFDGIPLSLVFGAMQEEWELILSDS